MLLVFRKADQDQLLLSFPMLLRPIPQPPELINASWGDCSLWQQGDQELTIGMLRSQFLFLTELERKKAEKQMGRQKEDI